MPLTTNGGWYMANNFFLTPASSFFIIGFTIWALRQWKTDQIEEPEFKISKNSLEAEKEDCLMLEAYLSMFIKAVFIENIAINFFLGMCTFLAISKRIQPAIGLGIAAIVVLGLAVPINNLIFNFFLKEDALYSQDQIYILLG